VSDPAYLVRLRRCAKETGRTVAETLQYYAMERFLFRLGHSRHREAFVLKGAMMLRAWDPRSARTTRDIDFLAYAGNDLDQMRRLLVEVCSQEVPSDGVAFDPDSLRLETIKEFDDYQGARARFTAHLESARVPMQLDIGFGDVVHPAAVWAEFPTVLPMPAPRVRMYSRGSVIAEQLHAIAKLGAINSRMKDYHDLWFLSNQHEFDLDELAGAIEATFRIRKTEIPDALIGLQDAYVANHAPMWRNHVQRAGASTGGQEDLAAVVLRLQAFLLPCLARVRVPSEAPKAWNSAVGTWIDSPRSGGK